MDVSRKMLIITMIVDLLLLVAGVICMVLLKFNLVSICLFAAITVCVLISSIIVWKYGKNFKK